MTTVEQLRELFYLDGNGILRWKIARSNVIKVGDVAGCVKADGRTFYREVRVNGRLHFAHQIVWSMVHGRWPLLGMDVAHHPDHDGLNNHPDNLHEVSHLVNCQGRRHQKGSSIFKGVTYEKESGKWRAQIQIDRHKKSLGRFADERQAALAYNTAAIEAFGEWATLNDVGDLA
jgi:hypothetical protein